MRTATYRVQLRGDFGFDQVAGIVDYLHDLGVSDLYSSPLLQAVAGSSHGYDVVDHSRLSAGLGGHAGFERLMDELRSRSMGLTVDIVPNHMAIDGRANRWWWDVLENGPSSLYASYFDIDWPGEGTGHEPTVLVPVLGDRYGKTLEDREVRLHREGGSFVVTYHDHELPLSPRTADTIVERAAEAVGDEELWAIAHDFAALPHAARTDPGGVRLRHERKERLAERLAEICDARPEAAAAMDREMDALRDDPDDLDRLLCRQNYRLAYWRTASEQLDYRRFFNIESLVALRVEDDQVFADTHQEIARLLREGAATGLRVDHVDGLRDPEGYLQRLRRLAPGAYAVVEKILHPGEEVPAGWPVEGTTGYDFIARVANVMVDQEGEEALTRCYARLTGEPGTYAEVVRASKLQIMTDELAPEVDRLTRLLHGICENHRWQRDRTRREVRDALTAVLASFPVYRTYVQPDRAAGDADAEHVAHALRAAKEMQPDTDADLFDFIGQLLLLEVPGGAETEFAQTFPQLSAPVMAKGVEDTAFYRYHRLVSLNEVGGDPGVFGRPLEEFHRATGRSAARFPDGMLTLDTHDTKRSSDVRSRISLLSEIPEHWEDAVTTWMGMTDIHAAAAGPDYNTRYLLFQTLVGTWPMGVDRLTAYMDKAAKEAKVHTSWADPDADFDYGLRKFVEATVADDAFVSALESFLREHRIVDMGRATSLAQTALLLTCPGIPDIYQGTEIFEHSLVDPDNRRPVDFAALASYLGSGPAGGADALSDDPYALRGKMWLIARLLHRRRARPDAYSGPYEELPVRGPREGRLIAFAREGVAVLVGRHFSRGGDAWGSTEVELPAGPWRPVVAGTSGDIPSGSHLVQEIMGHGPLAVLER